MTARSCTRFLRPLRPGLIETLPLLLEQAAQAHAITNIAVGTGPGSFTGLRTSIALAQGFAAAAGITLWGIPADAAYAVAFPQLHRPLWVAIRARKNRLFLLRDGTAEAFTDEDVPRPAAPIALAGDAAAETAARLAARNADVLLTNARCHRPLLGRPRRPIALRPGLGAIAGTARLYRPAGSQAARRRPAPRPAMSPAYAAVFAALHVKAFPHDPWNEASFATLLAQPGMHGFLDERGGFLLLRIVLDEAEIITIGAAPRRQGIATALMAQAIATARTAGVRKHSP